MFWVDKIANKLGNNEIINDSKTPSGRVHIGSLRGVILHYAIYKVLSEQGKNPTFYYGIDDYDPVDELPFGISSKWKQYMGKPLCNVPSPEAGKADNFADYYINEFIDLFNNLGIEPKIYKMNDLYRSGKMNETIDLVLCNEDKIRDIYLRVSGSRKPSNWHPFQVICERCGKIGTTLVHSFDGKEVEYTCEKSMVKWARGCEYRGKISPFDGNGKLPWKLEWVGKWKVLSVSVEGAGKDHSSKGGSRDVSAAIYGTLFGEKPPYNIPYEFFLTGKKKMSSSKGIGSSSKDIADLLPPELLLFLMIRYSPLSVIDFDPSGDTIPRLFDEYDRLGNLFFDSKTNENDSNTELLTRAFELSQVKKDLNKTFYPRFSNIATLVQIPGVSLKEKLGEMKEKEPNSHDLEELSKREFYANKWLRNCAKEQSIFSVKEELSKEIKDGLNDDDKSFIKELTFIFDRQLGGEELHQKIYEASQRVNMKPAKAFKLLYKIFIAKSQGPRIGTLLSALDHNFVQKRLEEALSS